MNRFLLLCLAALVSNVVLASAQTCFYDASMHPHVVPANTGGSVSTGLCSALGSTADNMDSTGTLAPATCTFGCAPGWSSSSSGPALDITAICTGSTGTGNTITNDPSSACGTFVCDGAATVTYPTNVFQGTCSNPTRASPVASCATAAVAGGFGEFNGGNANAGSKTTTITCSGANTFTSGMSAAIQTACDVAAPNGGSSISSNIPSGALDNSAGACSTATLGTTPISGQNSGVCGANLAATYFNFGTSFSSASGNRGTQTAVPLTCTGSNTWTSTTIVKTACSVAPTVSTISGGVGGYSNLDYTSGTCSTISTSSALAFSDICYIGTASGYYDWMFPSAPSTSVLTACSMGSTLYQTGAATNILAGCNTPPATASAAGINTAAAILTTGTCNSGGSPVSSSNVFQAGLTTKTCTVNLDSATNRWYDFNPSTPQTSVTVSCTGINTFAPSASNVVQACVNPTVSSPPTGTVVGSCGTGAITANGSPCNIACAPGFIIDPVNSNPSKLAYTCNAATNTVSSSTPPICIPSSCSTAPAANDFYDFTAGTTPCASVSGTNTVASGATCTLACKGNTVPKGNVAPTFTCDSTTQTLKPTNFDICVPMTALPITIFTFGTKLS